MKFIQGLGWGGVLLCAILISSCQRSPSIDREQILLQGSESSLNEKGRTEFPPQLEILVERDNSYNALMRAGLKHIVEGQSLTCELETDPEKFSPENKWHPIPILFVTRAEGESGEMEDQPLGKVFLDRLKFKKIKSTPTEILFYVKFFEPGDKAFNFESLLKINPVKRTVRGKTYCVAETRICPNPPLDKATQSYSCSDQNWKWVKQLLADATFFGSITGLSARWAFLDANGNEVMSKPEKLK